MPVKKDVLDDDFEIFNYTSNDYEKIMDMIPLAKKVRVVKPLPPGKHARVSTPKPLPPGKHARVSTPKPLPPGKHARVSILKEKNPVQKSLIENKNPLLAEYSKKKGCEGSKLYNPSTKRCIDFTNPTGKSVSISLNKIKYDLFKSEKKLTVEEKQLLFKKFDDFKEKKNNKNIFKKKK